MKPGQKYFLVNEVTRYLHRASIGHARAPNGTFFPGIGQGALAFTSGRALSGERARSMPRESDELNKRSALMHVLDPHQTLDTSAFWISTTYRP